MVFFKKGIIIIIVCCLFIFITTKIKGQPYLICDPPLIEDNVTQYYIKCCKSDPNMYNIDPNNSYSILMPIDPNISIEVKDGFSDPNFFVKAAEDGSLYLNLEDVKTNISYSLLVQACDNFTCGCPSFISFIPKNVPHKIKNISITKEGCNVNIYNYITIQ